MFKICLVVGCGGTGSEIIKLLKLFSYEITAVDFDKIETTNFNRQFYYTKKDLGKFKAEIIKKKLNIRSYCENFKNLKINFRNFDLIFSCLDSVADRMELNYQFCKCGNDESILIDVGVEGLLGHAKKVRKYKDSCLYCIKDLYPSLPDYSYCSLLSIGTKINTLNRSKLLKQHVLKMKEEDASISDIVKEFNNKILNKEIFTSTEEVESYYYNIIPNICTINSIIASLAINLIFDNINNYYFFNYEGNDINIVKERIEIDEKCFVCKNKEKN